MYIREIIGHTLLAGMILFSAGNQADSSVKQGFTETLPGNVKLEMAAIPGGSFKMGRYWRGIENSYPIHKVNLKPFFIGKHEVTQAQWKAVMGTNPSHFKGEDLPLESVSWNDAKEFCQKLSKITGKEYRLPSEAEWEYAALAGSTGDYCFGNKESLLPEYAWYRGNSEAKTHPVGQKKPNVWGLYDMHGNVGEWCEDVWHDNYEKAPTDGSAWTTGGNQDRRLLRGGAWYYFTVLARAAARLDFNPSGRFEYIGVRVACGGEGK